MPNSGKMLLLMLLLLLTHLCAGNATDCMVNVRDKAGNWSSAGLIIQGSGIIVTPSQMGEENDSLIIQMADKSIVAAKLAVQDKELEICFWGLNKASSNWLDLEAKSSYPVAKEMVFLQAPDQVTAIQNSAVCLSYFKNGNIRLLESSDKLYDGSCAFNKYDQFVGMAFSREINDKQLKILIPAAKIQNSYRKNLPALLNATKNHLPDNVLLTLQGSNTIGSQLADSLAKYYLLGLGGKNISFLHGLKAEEKQVRSVVNGRQVTIQINAHGSATAFSGLKEGACDIGLSSRPIKPEEISDLSALGSMTSYQNEHVLALDGIAIIVNRANPLSKLTTTDLARIFAGEIKDWSELTPNFSGSIKLFSRNDESGTFDTFKALVLSISKPAKKMAAGALKIESSTELSDLVAKDVNAIGFIGLPYIKECKPLEIAQQISESEESAFYPSVFSIATEDYALSRRLFLYTPEKSSNPHSRGFVEFALSDRGQQIAEEVGFVSQQITLEKPILPINATPRYCNAINQADRLSLNFRFKTGSFELDNKSYRDLSRLISFLQKHRSRQVMLLGFADNIGSAQINYQLSQKRALTISDYLKKWGIRTNNILALGQEVPIASNATEDGRQKNRRVEVLLKN